MPFTSEVTSAWQVTFPEGSSCEGWSQSRQTLPPYSLSIRHLD